MKRSVVLILAATAVVVAACGDSDSGQIATATTTSAATPVTTPELTATTTTGANPTESTAPAAEITAVDPATFSADGNGIAWISPSKNVWCRISPDYYGSGCQSYDAPVPAGAACVNPTFTVDQLTKGFFLMPDGVQPACFNQGVFSTEFASVLEYGQSVTYSGYTCTSLRTGMTCTTGGGHGFELSREVARAF